MMRRIGWICGFGLLVACVAGAQVNPQNAVLVVPADAAATPAAPATPAPDARANLAAEPADPTPANASADPQGGVHPVISEDYWQAYIGYTFLRVYEVRGITVNTNGLNVSLQRYFPSISWLGLDGEFTGTEGNVFCSKSASGMGGVRARLDARNGIELWAHGMLGVEHILPQTAFGSQTAFAYQLGGGADFTVPHLQRFAFRVAADAVGTRFFSTNQVSPKISAGIVFRF